MLVDGVGAFANEVPFVARVYHLRFVPFAVKAVAVAFRQIAKVEAEHEARYRKLLANVTEGKVFEKDEEIMWQCRNCGWTFKGKKAPKTCPACEHAQSYFEPMKQNY